MTTTRASYSVVQYVPDGGRQEAANIGVVLWVPSERWLEMRTAPSLERIRRFFSPGRQELRRIELAVDALRDRLELARHEFTTEADLAQFAASRADPVRLTMPRLVMVQNPSVEVVTLFDELVGERGTVLEQSRPTGAAIPAPLAEVFARLEAKGLAWRPGDIEIPSADRRFEVPVAFANGQDNYVRPESLADRRAIDALLAKLAFCGRLIHEHGIDDRASRLVVISTDPAANPRVEDRFRRTLPEFQVRFVGHGDAGDFAQEVQRTAHARM